MFSILILSIYFTSKKSLQVQHVASMFRVSFLEIGISTNVELCALSGHVLALAMGTEIALAAIGEAGVSLLAVEQLVSHQNIFDLF